MTFNNHSGWKLLKACRKCIFSEYLYTFVSICFEFDTGFFLGFFFFFFFFFSLTRFVKKKKKGTKKTKRKKKSDEQY